MHNFYGIDINKLASFYSFIHFSIECLAKFGY